MPARSERRPELRGLSLAGPLREPTPQKSLERLIFHFAGPFMDRSAKRGIASMLVTTGVEKTPDVSDFIQGVTEGIDSLRNEIKERPNDSLPATRTFLESRQTEFITEQEQFTQAERDLRNEYNAFRERATLLAEAEASNETNRKSINMFFKLGRRARGFEREHNLLETQRNELVDERDGLEHRLQSIKAAQQEGVLIQKLLSDIGSEDKGVVSSAILYSAYYASGLLLGEFIPTMRKFPEEKVNITPKAKRAVAALLEIAPKTIGEYAHGQLEKVLVA